MLEPVLAQFQKTYPQDVRIVFRPFPLISIHPNARLAAVAAEAAGKQGQFQPMASALFENQQTWSGMPDADFRAWLKNTAGDLGLDTAAFASDLDSVALGKKIDDAYDAAIKAGVDGTPFILINGAPYRGERSYATFEVILKLLKLTDRQYISCPPVKINPAKKYIATIQTTKGDIVLELFPDKAPVAVNSFIFLAQQGWYNDNPFYGVHPGEYVMTGDPTGTNNGDPGYYYDSEISDLRFDRAGVVGVNNSVPNVNGGRFFITLSPQPDLDGGFTIIGQVVEGLNVLSSFPAFPPEDGQADTEPVMIRQVTVAEE